MGGENLLGVSRFLSGIVGSRFSSGLVPYWVELLVLVLLQGFFSWYSVFFSLQKTNISKFQFNQDIDSGPASKPSKANVASSINVVNYLICSYVLFFAM